MAAKVALSCYTEKNLIVLRKPFCSRCVGEKDVVTTFLIANTVMQCFIILSSLVKEAAVK